jgi:TRAP-type C4-dicarboxylate transport system permease small subunit
MNNPNEIAKSILSALRKAERFLCVCAFATLVLIIFADVVSRELTNAGLYWASQTGVWANVLIVMAGFGIASSEGTHLRPRFTDSWLPQSWQKQLQFIQHLLMSGFCAAAFAAATLRHAIYAFNPILRPLESGAFTDTPETVRNEQ